MSAVRSCGVETDHVPPACVAVPLDVCPDSVLPHCWILKMEHTVSVTFTVLVLLLVTVLRTELRASHALGKPLSCGAVFSGYQTDIVEEHGIYFHNASIIYK